MSWEHRRESEWKTVEMNVKKKSSLVLSGHFTKTTPVKGLGSSSAPSLASPAAPAGWHPHSTHLIQQNETPDPCLCCPAVLPASRLTSIITFTPQAAFCLLSSTELTVLPRNSLLLSCQSQGPALQPCPTCKPSSRWRHPGLLAPGSFPLRFLCHHWHLVSSSLSVLTLLLSCPDTSGFGLAQPWPLWLFRE